MQRLEFNRPNNLNLLHEQLIAAVLTFHRTVIGADGQFQVAPDGGRVSGFGDQITIEFADDIIPALVTAVVNAHNPADLSAGQQSSAQMAQTLADFQATVAGLASGPTKRAFVDLQAYLTARFD